jgi:hypothetical protein
LHHLTRARHLAVRQAHEMQAAGWQAERRDGSVRLRRAQGDEPRRREGLGAGMGLGAVGQHDDDRWPSHGAARGDQPAATEALIIGMRREDQRRARAEQRIGRGEGQFAHPREHRRRALAGRDTPHHGGEHGAAPQAKASLVGVLHCLSRPHQCPERAPFRVLAAYRSGPGIRTPPAREATPAPHQDRASGRASARRDEARVTVARAPLPPRRGRRHLGACGMSCACCTRIG